MRNKLLAAACTVAAVQILISSSPATAAVSTIHSVIDLTKWNLNTTSIDLFGSAPDSAMVSQGDSLVVDVDFLGNQLLQLGTVTRITIGLNDMLRDNYTSGGTIGLYDLTGNLNGLGRYVGYGNCCVLNLNFTTNPGNYDGTGPISFSGIRFTFDNIGFVTPTPAQRRVAGSFVEIATNGIDNRIGTLPGAGSVPEPSSWALMLGGFGLLGTMLRRRRSPRPGYAVG